MKKALLIFTALSVAFFSGAQNNFQFKTVVEAKNTKTKDQANTGTCWSFATISFLESEALRNSNDTFDLSEMFMVRYSYPKKALKYFEPAKETPRFAEGGLSHDVMYIIKNYGLVPDQAFNGLHYGLPYHDHAELDAMLSGLVSGLKKSNVPISSNILNSVDLILDNYLGEVPSYFSYKGQSHTPQSFAKDVIKINPDDYISITSFTHHPYNSKFVLEIPDNWFGGEYYNVELNEFIEIMDYALQNGYTVAWDGDVSEREFAHKKGVALWPAKLWKDKTADEQKAFGNAYEPELAITAEIRQQNFENGTTTDDHLMHITGIANDAAGNKYYITKNSWGEKSNSFSGKLYMSEAYVRMKSISFMVHKNALPNKMAKKLGL